MIYMYLQYNQVDNLITIGLLWPSGDYHIKVTETTDNKYGRHLIEK